MEGNVQIVGEFRNTSATSARIKFSDANTGAENVNIGAIGTSLVMWTNNTERARILTGGNFGINTTNPQARLHVNGDVRIDDAGSAPSVTEGNGITAYFGVDEKFYLAEPNAWLNINVSGTDYVIPLYTAP